MVLVTIEIRNVSNRMKSKELKGNRMNSNEMKAIGTYVGKMKHHFTGKASRRSVAVFTGKSPANQDWDSSGRLSRSSRSCSISIRILKKLT